MSSRLFIENIGSEEALIAKAHSEDVAFVERFSNEGRRCEVLAWRAIVRRELGCDVRFDTMSMVLRWWMCQIVLLAYRIARAWWL